MGEQEEPPEAGETDGQGGLQDERWELLTHVTAITDKLMVALAMVWLGLLIVEFTQGLGPKLQLVVYAIWIVFVLDFAIKFAFAPRKAAYLRRNWLTAISLLLPAFRVLSVFRVFRLLRFARAARSVGLLRLITSMNRGMGALGQTLGSRGLGYVVALTVIVTFAGAAGMFHFEGPPALRQGGLDDADRGESGIRDYGEAIWWTAMIMTTMGSEYWPRTIEGRILCWLLSVYSFVFFGYLTATLASLFIGRGNPPASPPATTTPGPADLAALRGEISELRVQVPTLSASLKETIRPPEPRDQAPPSKDVSS